MSYSDKNEFLTILHGYRLDGSGSCVYVSNITREYVRAGKSVVLHCQEPEPEKYDYLSEGYEMTADGEIVQLFKRCRETNGRGVYLRPYLKDRLLPVFVAGEFPGFENVKPITELNDSELQSYVDTNVYALLKSAEMFPSDTIFANHIVVTPYIAALAREQNRDLDYFLIPHGSEIEYLMKRDRKFLEMARKSLSDAKGIVSGSDEIFARIENLFEEYLTWKPKTRIITIGVDSDQFFSPLASDKSTRIEGPEAGDSEAD